MQVGQVVCHIRAAGRALLSAERPALNFLQMLSGVATTTQCYVQAIEGLSPNPRGCVVLDTRKTLPGLRQAQKYAVRVGGGQNQRMALWDGILIKENHIAAAGGIAQALQAAQAPVSYTHLDVYKRQHPHGEPVAARAADQHVDGGLRIAVAHDGLGLRVHRHLCGRPKQFGPGPGAHRRVAARAGHGAPRRVGRAWLNGGQAAASDVRMSNPDIVCLASWNVDLVSRVARPVARGETLMASSFDISPGGKGSNAAVAAARQGARVALVARIGDDEFGRMGLALWAAEGIDTELVEVVRGERSGVAQIQVFDDGDNSIAVYRGAGAGLDLRHVHGAAPLLQACRVVMAPNEVSAACTEEAFRCV